jgi:DNA-directed RNA polymerase subunit beta
MDLPNLIDIQLASYESFLQRKGSKYQVARQGLLDVFMSIFPI